MGWRDSAALLGLVLYFHVSDGMFDIKYPLVGRYFESATLKGGAPTVKVVWDKGNTLRRWVNLEISRPTLILYITFEMKV